MNEFVPGQMWIWQLPQSVKRGSIHGSSQNIRELGPVSSFFVMSDWILPFFLWWVWADSFSKITQILIFYMSHVNTQSMSNESLFQLRILKMCWTLKKGNNHAETGLVKLAGLCIELYSMQEQFVQLLQNLGKLNLVNKSCAKRWTCKQADKQSGPLWVFIASVWQQAQSF